MNAAIAVAPAQAGNIRINGGSASGLPKPFDRALDTLDIQLDRRRYGYGI